MKFMFVEDIDSGQLTFSFEMIKIVRTNSKHIDFVNLVKLLDADLAIRDGDDHEFYNQFNNIDELKHVVIAYEGETAVGCGAFKVFDKEAVEIKRMYVGEKSRGKGIAGKMLTELEQWAKEMTYTNCILETGIKQPEAIRLYEKAGYSRTPNYGQYEGVETSFCFVKEL